MLRMQVAHFVLLTVVAATSADGSVQGNDGELSKALVSSVVRAHLASVKACYDRAHAKDATLQGALSLDWTIEPDGRVSRATVASSTLNSSDVENCILRQVTHWVFPKATRTTQVTRFPFAFKDRPSPKAPADAGADGR
jgi:hypothetical protein